MKRTMGMILCLILVALPLMAQTAAVKLAWDPNAVSEQVSAYVIYEKIGTAYSKVIELPAATACTASVCTAEIPNVARGIHTYVATAKNLWGESGYSNEASTPPGATAPKNIVITITITITP